MNEIKKENNEEEVEEEKSAWNWNGGKASGGSQLVEWMQDLLSNDAKDN